jgi:endonuclease YncB( thermonuclease family)
MMVVEEIDGELVYRMLHYRPGLDVTEKNGPMVYRVVELTEDRVIFEDPEREFPRRLVYVREGDRLHFHFEGVRDGEPTTIRMDFDQR